VSALDAFSSVDTRTRSGWARCFSDARARAPGGDDVELLLLARAQGRMAADALALRRGVALGRVGDCLRLGPARAPAGEPSPRGGEAATQTQPAASTPTPGGSDPAASGERLRGLEARRDAFRQRCARTLATAFPVRAQRSGGAAPARAQGCVWLSGAGVPRLSGRDVDRIAGLGGIDEAHRAHVFRNGPKRGKRRSRHALHDVVSDASTLAWLRGFPRRAPW
jgi:hypothetical protein